MPHPRLRRCARTATFTLVGSSLALSTALAPSVSAAATVSPTVAPYMEMAGPDAGNLSAGISAGLRSVTAAFVIGKKCTPVWDDNTPVATDTAATTAIRERRDQPCPGHRLVRWGGRYRPREVVHQPDAS